MSLTYGDDKVTIETMKRNLMLSKDAATLTPAESRKITRFGLNRTYAMLREGSMPAIKVGNRYFIPKAALLRWLEECGSKST